MTLWKSTPHSVWLFAIVTALIISLPYIVGWANTPEGWRYSGATVTPDGYRVDYYAKMANMWQGNRGEWNNRLLFTHEDHPALFSVQGFYLAIGALSNMLPYGLEFTFHLVRFVFTVLLIVALWVMACRFFEKSGDRWAVVLFGTLIWGWGWLLFLIAPEQAADVAPIEFWLSDAYNVFGAMLMPHFAAAIFLQIVAMLSFDRWLRMPDGANAYHLIIAMTVSLAVVAVIQPYVVLLFVPLIGLLTVYYVFSAKTLPLVRAFWLIIPVGIHGGIGLAQYLMISTAPVWSGFATQNITASPDLQYYLLGFGPFIIPILFGTRYLLIEDDEHGWLMPVLWVLLVAMLIYGPFPTQRRYLLGVQSPLALLAAYGWVRGMMPRIPVRRRFAFGIVYFVSAMIGPLMLVILNTSSMSQPMTVQDLYYTPDELNGYAWLSGQAEPDTIVLTTLNEQGLGSGGRLVAATGIRVFIGHWFETAHFEAKVKQLRRFYNEDTADDWRRRFLSEIGAGYIWIDESVGEYGSWEPSGADYLERVFESPTIEIYRVMNE